MSYNKISSKDPSMQIKSQEKSGTYSRNLGLNMDIKMLAWNSSRLCQKEWYSYQKGQEESYRHDLFRDE